MSATPTTMTDQEWAEAFVGCKIEGVGYRFNDTVGILVKKLAQVRQESRAGTPADESTSLASLASMWRQRAMGLNEDDPAQGAILLCARELACQTTRMSTRVLPVGSIVIRENTLGRWIISPTSNQLLAWSGSRWVAIDSDGVPLSVQICNFATAGEAVKFAEGIPEED